MTRSARRILIALLWIALFAGALAVDGPVAQWVRRTGLEKAVHGKGFAEAIKVAGYYWFTLIVAAGLCLWHPLRWRAGAFLALCGLVSGVNWFVKWCVGRTRPFKLVDLPPGVAQPAPFVVTPFKGGWHGLVSTPNLDFPSGHACLSFATAAALAVLLPRWKPLWYALALVVCAERVAENAHYLSDVVGGAALGLVGVWFVRLVAGRGLLGPAAELRGMAPVVPTPVRHETAGRR